MLSVQNSETWALSQANPKTKPIFHQTAPVCPKKQSLFFQKRSFPKTVTDFPKIGGRFSQNRWRISPKSVADFPKIGDGFPQNRWRISPNSVADFLKVCNGFSQNRWQIFPKSVMDFLKIGGWFPSFYQKRRIGGWFSQSPWLISSKSDDWLPQDFPKNCPQISTNPQIPNQPSQNRTNSLPKTGAVFFLLEQSQSFPKTHFLLLLQFRISTHSPKG